MIKNCITRDTRVFKFKDYYEGNELKVIDVEKLAKIISSETGVPHELIYKPPYLSYIHQWYKINGEWYFFKNNDYDFWFINELLGEVISRYFGLETIHYNVAKLYRSATEVEYGLISKNFCDKNSVYRRAPDLNLTHQDDMSVLWKIEKICRTEEEYLSLLDDLKKFFIRDFFATAQDRTANNFLFVEKSSGIRLAPLYDYERSFEGINPSRYENQIGCLDINNYDTYQLLKNDLRFQELLELLMDANILEMLTEIEDAHRVDISLTLKKHYLRRETEIKRLVLERKLLK